MGAKDIADGGRLASVTGREPRGKISRLWRMNQRDPGTPPTDRDETLSRLQRILQALAVSGQPQKALFPSLVVRGDELALEFDRCYHVLLDNGYHSDLPADAQGVLSEIDRAFDRMVDAREHVWSAEGAAEPGEWVTMRRLAAQALQSLGWPRYEPGGFEEG